jgi:hypothetical protein
VKKPKPVTDWRAGIAKSIDSQPPVDPDVALVQRARRLYTLLIDRNAPVTAGDSAVAQATILAALIAAAN